MRLVKSWFKFSQRSQFIRHFSSEKPFREISIPVPWGQIRGKWWGRTDIRPILTLHGWQDNCGSFDRLIPLLNKEVGFLTIDLPGHGYSSRLPPGIYYHFTIYLSTLKFIIRYMGWDNVSLMGHSMGGITSYVYTMLYPQTVDFVACLDGAKPMSRPKVIANMAKSIDQFLKSNDYVSSGKEPPSYTLEEIKQKVHIPNKGSVALEYANCLIERNIAPSKLFPGKYYFTRDPRLKSGELLSFSQNELVEQAQHITCPIFISKCKEGSYYEVKNNFYEVLDVLKRSSSDCDFHYVEGTHHVHLNAPDEVAGLLNKFILRHNTEDRTIGGLKDEMVVREDQDLSLKVRLA
ncbi:probable serine hydrolase [Anthonomus grandis grandis]|uniref:probable serine hydrolase n=1 Tax=Anthonomus grandis grandis TaxID=2921223 RepID=UPI00216515F4|nr:probable serine hydrolase [Anthonomus grandis grandis]